MVNAFSPQDEPDASVFGWLWIAVEVVAFAVMVVLLWRGSELSGATFFGLAFVLWGVTAFGLAHALVEFVVMAVFNEYNWDTPPGTGWITVAGLVIAGSASLWFGGRRDESPTVA